MVNLNSLKKEKIYIEHYSGAPAYIEMTGFGFTSRLYGSDFLVYPFSLSYFKNGRADWLAQTVDHQKIGLSIVDKYLKNKNDVLKLYEIWLKNYGLMMKIFFLFYSADLKGKSDRELLAWAELVYDFYRHKISMPGFLDGFMFYADGRLDKLLSEFCLKHGISDYQKIYSVLGAPTELSFIAREKNELAKLSSIKDQTKFEKAIHKHLDKYAWLKSSYAGYLPYTKNMALAEIKELKKSRQVLKQENVKAKKQQLLKKYKFTPEIIALAELSERFSKWQDLRKEYTLTFVTLQDKILREVSRRTKLSHDLLKYVQSEELADILKNNFSVSILKERRAGCLFVYSKGKIEHIYTKKLASDFFKSVSQIKTKNVKELKGFVANVGWARGTVRIVRSITDVKKVKAGDILLSPMTRPEHLAAMKKAVAIVTDDGGITCHAAIVARELGLPCVIGTKIATRVFKDGDKVEVDANRGIIKKL